jgi:hypothetical protein
VRKRDNSNQENEKELSHINDDFHYHTNIVAGGPKYSEEIEESEPHCQCYY